MREIQALDAFKGGKVVCSAKDLAYRIGINRNSANYLLRKFWKEGLTTRKRIGKEINYRITEKGMKRLKYLKRQRIKEISAFWK